jgi:electron transport complex protein RnfC
MCITIEPDGNDQWTDKLQSKVKYIDLDRSALRNVIREAGIVGLGGAGFPSFVKLNPGPQRKVETLILNAAECEPYITCDDMLMRERPDEILAGIQVMKHALQPAETLIAIEDNKPEAAEALREAIKDSGYDIQLVVVPAIYPAGGEKQLIYTVTGKQVPSNGLPIHVGVVCQNVGTAASMHHAINLGRPLVSRIMTIAGDVGAPANFEVLLGTPVDELIKNAGNALADPERIIMGGPMMGFALHTDAVPVIKTTNCILVDAGQNREFATPQITMPCIRCGHCAEVCPVNLLPQQLYWYTHADDLEQTQQHDLFDCIECGCCDYVCPSKIPLVQYYRYAKAEIWDREREKQKSDIARRRHEFRQQRLEREKAEREARHKRKKAQLQAKTGGGDDKADVDAKRAAILAAMERAKAKKAKAGPNQTKNIDNLTPEQQRKIREVDERRAHIEQERKSTQKDKEPRD